MEGDSNKPNEKDQKLFRAASFTAIGAFDIVVAGMYRSQV